MTRCQQNRLRWMLSFMPALIAIQSLFASGPYFRGIRLPESLTVINCMYQDSAGNFWIGSSSGLFRYDGNGFNQMTARTSDQPVQVSAVYMDVKGVLWVGTKSGSIFLLSGDSLLPFQPQEGLPAKMITGFANDQQGNLWFSTYGEGLYYYNGRYLYNINAEDGLTDDYCYCLLADAEGRIWTGTDAGISVCYASDKHRKTEQITTQHGLPDNIVLKLTAASNGIIWAGMQDGGYCSVNSKTLRVNPPLFKGSWPYGPIRDMVVFNDILWLSSDKHGIIETDPLHPEILRSYTKGGNAEFAKVNLLLSDNQGNFWIATTSDLIFSSGPGFSQFKQINGTSPGNVQAILAVKDGSIWYSNEGRLFRYYPGNRPGTSPREYHIPLRNHTHIISLYEDPAGYVWVGTFGSGLFRVNPVNGRTRLISETEGMTNGNILSMDGNEKDLWLATLGGAYKCIFPGNLASDGALFQFENFSQKNGPGNNYIYCVFIDSRNRVWFGTDGKGIAVYENGQFRSFSENDGFKSKVVYSITEDSKGNLWFTTPNDGAFMYDGTSFRNLTTAHGLSDMQVSCLAADHLGHVFFAYDRGIDILDINTNSFIYYGPEYGLEAIDPDLNVISFSADHQLWLGTKEGIVRIELPEIRRAIHPSLRLDRVSVFLGNENFLHKDHFLHNENHLSFYFTGTWFSAPELLTYQVKLEGYDLDWITTRDDMVTYSSLPPGTYTFNVRCGLKNNFEHAKVLTYRFTIGKPWWKQTWFLVFAVLLAAALVILLIRIRDRRFKLKEASEREKLLFQLQTLRSQVNPHFLFNSFSTLISVIDEDKEMAIEYVQKLSLFFRNILEYRDKDLITLQEELRLTETYFYLQQQRYGSGFRMETNLPAGQLQTLVPPLTMQMLIENAVKHNSISTDKPLIVKIYSEDGFIKVSNNLQKKKLLETSTGIGLENIRNRYNLLEQQGFSVKETMDEFCVQLPIINP